MKWKVLSLLMCTYRALYKRNIYISDTESPCLVDVHIEPNSAYWWLAMDVGIVHLSLVLGRVTFEFDYK